MLDDQPATNMYFVVNCKSHSQAKAITEAHELAIKTNCHVDIHECGTRKTLFKVFPTGEVIFPKGS